MGAIASQITSLTIVYSTVYSDANQRKHQSSASLAFVRWIPAQMASNAKNVSIWWRHHEGKRLLTALTWSRTHSLAWLRHFLISIFHSVTVVRRLTHQYQWNKLFLLIAEPLANSLFTGSNVILPSRISMVVADFFANLCRHESIYICIHIMCVSYILILKKKTSLLCVMSINKKHLEHQTIRPSRKQCSKGRQKVKNNPRSKWYLKTIVSYYYWLFWKFHLNPFNRFSAVRTKRSPLVEVTSGTSTSQSKLRVIYSAISSQIPWDHINYTYWCSP